MRRKDLNQFGLGIIFARLCLSTQLSFHLDRSLGEFPLERGNRAGRGEHAFVRQA